METVAQTLEAAAELAREHDEIDRLATLISTLEAGPARRAIVLDACTRYAVHAQVEEHYLMPALRRYLPDGAKAAAAETGRHQAVVQTIGAYLRLCDRTGVEGAPSGAASTRPAEAAAAHAARSSKRSGHRCAAEPCAEFDAVDELDIVVGQLVAGIQCHVELQDSVVLPQLNRVCPLVESRRLGTQLREAIAAATRAEQAAAEPHEHHHRIRGLLHHLVRGLSVRAEEPAHSG